jgi:hypothetical protein
MRQVVIEYLIGGGPRQPENSAPEVEFVDGPWAGRREQMSKTPSSIAADGGSYHHSVRCPDDGGLRFVFVADPTEPAR